MGSRERGRGGEGEQGSRGAGEMSIPYYLLPIRYYLLPITYYLIQQALITFKIIIIKRTDSRCKTRGLKLFELEGGGLSR